MERKAREFVESDRETAFLVSFAGIGVSLLLIFVGWYGLGWPALIWQICLGVIALFLFILWGQLDEQACVRSEFERRAKSERRRFLNEIPSTDKYTRPAVTPVY